MTLIEVLAPSRAAVTVSWAYTNCRGPVESVTVKVPTPLVKTEDAGKLALPSLLRICTTPL